MVPSMDAVPFFTGLGEVMRDGVPAPDVLAAFGRKWDVEFLGPPLKALNSGTSRNLVRTDRRRSRPDSRRQGHVADP